MISQKKRIYVSDWLLEIILLLLLIFFGIVANNFFTAGNFFNIARNISFKGIIACFMTLVIISGEIDLSVGSTVAFSGVLTAYLNKILMAEKVPSVISMVCAIVIAIAASAVIGFMISVFVTSLRVPSFIATLAGMQLMRGLALILANGFPIQGYPAWFKVLGSGYIGPIPVPALVFLLFVIICGYILKNTPFGRAVYAVGSNVEAASFSGINVRKMKRTIFMLISMSAGLVGIMVSAQLNSGSPNVGELYEMDAISSVIIGGASLTGGSGTIRGTLVGCIFTGIIINSLTLMGISDYWKYVVRGLLIVFAVFLNTLVKQKMKEKNW